MHGLIKGTSSRRQRASARRHFRDGCSAAVARAFIAARLYLDRTLPTLAQAVAGTGSNTVYVRAAIAVLRDVARDPQRMEQSVLTGRVSLPAAARLARRRQKARVTVEEATTAWRGWSPAMRAAFGKSIGAAQIWDDCIVPVIGEDRGDRVRVVAAE
jgi:hypothetical protein